MDEKNVYILYEADQWILTPSLVPMGVFDSWPRVMDSAMTLLQEQWDKGLHESVGDDIEDLKKTAYDELLEHAQFRGDGASIFIKTVELNKLEEI